MKKNNTINGIKRAIVCFPAIMFCVFCDSQSWHNVSANFSSGLGSVGGNLAVYKSKLFLATGFDSLNGIRINQIASWDGSKWDTCGLGLEDGPPILGVFNNDLYAGGGEVVFTKPTIAWILRWDGFNWYGTGIIGSDNCNRIYAMTEYKGELYVGGQYSQIGGKAVHNIAKWDGTAWSDVGGGLGGGFDEVTCMAVYNGELYVGGAFFSTGNGTIAVNCIARWNGSKWDSVAGGFIGGGPGAMVVDTVKNILYASGGLFQSDTTKLFGVAQWDGIKWKPVGDDTVVGGAALSMYHGELYSGGRGGIYYHGKYLSGIARWDGSLWLPLGTGINNGEGVYSMAVYNDELYASGVFTEVNGDTSIKYIGRWSMPLGINELKISGSNIKVYPNPSKDQLTIEFCEQIQGSYSIQLINLLGQPVLTQLNIQSPTINVDVSTLPKSLYIMEVRQSSGLVGRQRIIVE